MSAQTTETILLQVDVVANSARITELARETRLAKEEFAKLQAQVKAGKADADLLDAASVKLKATLAANTQETRVLTAANAAQLKATQAGAGSIEQLRAQLALGTAEYNKLSAAERDNTEAGQKLQASNKQLSDNLKVLEGAIGDTRRNVGNYAASFEPLIANLVKLQEQQKTVAANSPAYDSLTKQIGFVQKAAEDAGAKMGLNPEQTKAKLAQVGDAIRVPTAELVKLEAEQAKVEKGTTAYEQIGFKMKAAAKEIDKVPTELKQVEAATEGVKSGFSSALSKGLAPFQNELDRGTGLLGKFKSGTDLVKDGMGLLKGAGETGSLGFKALAGGIALTGIGLFVIAISAVVAYFTQTAEGGKILAGVLGGLGGVLQVATDLVTGLGKSLVYAVTHPIEAIQTLGRTITNALLHPIDTARELAAGVSKVADRVKDAYLASSEFAARTRELVVARRELDKQDAIEESRVNVLLRLSKERGKAATDQLAALEEAGKIEQKITQDNIALKQRELQLIDDKIKAAGAGKTAELKADKAAKELEIIQATTAQDEVNAKIQVRESVFREKLRAERAAAAQKAREDAVRAQITQQELLLLQVQKGSADELVVRQRLVQLAANLEIVSAKKTAAEKQLIQAKANVDSQKLEEEYDQKQVELAKKRTEAAKIEQKREYDENVKYLDDYLEAKKLALEKSLAAGEIDEKAYALRSYQQEQAGLAAKIVLAKDYKQDVAALNKQLTDGQIKNLAAQTAEERKVREQQLQQAEAFGAAAGDILAQSLTEQGASLESFAAKFLVLILDMLEKQVLASATAAIATSSVSSFAQPDSVATFGATGLARAAILTGLITAAFEVAKAGVQSALTPPKFATGGIVPGQGNTDSVSILATPGEIVMNKSASQQFAPVLSYLNSLAGGANFTPGFNPQQPRQIDGGLTARALGGSVGIDYQQLAHAIAQQPVSVDVRAIAAQQGRVARARSLTTLG